MSGRQLDTDMDRLGYFSELVWGLEQIRRLDDILAVTQGWCPRRRYKVQLDCHQSTRDRAAYLTDMHPLSQFWRLESEIKGPVRRVSVRVSSLSATASFSPCPFLEVPVLQRVRPANFLFF